MKKKIKDLTYQDRDRFCEKYNTHLRGKCRKCPLNINVDLTDKVGHHICLMSVLDEEVELESMCIKQQQQQSDLKKQNKTAKEMFEELGYKIVYDKVDFKLYHKNKDNELPSSISFFNFEDCKDYSVGGAKITIELHKAIHKQIEELGWLE